MRSRRPRTATVFFAMGIVLIAAIALGQRLGDRVMQLATQRRVTLPEVSVTPAPEGSDPDAGRLRNWHRLEVVSVATDPAFPDPRLTPPPPPPPPPAPVPRATPRPSPSPALTVPSADQLYTSPPLPIPIVSHTPEEEPQTEPSP